MGQANALESDWAEQPWQVEGTLRRLYVDGGKSTHEIADDLGCTHPTVLRWMEKFSIPTREQSEATSRSTRKEYATHQFTEKGYERWVSYHDGKRPDVHVHQLLACLDHDPHEVFAPDTEVHHTTGHGLDNRPEAVELLTASEHSKHHADADVPECKRRLLQTVANMEEGRA